MMATAFDELLEVALSHPDQVGMVATVMIRCSSSRRMIISLKPAFIGMLLGGCDHIPFRGQADAAN
jgi:hypothetical protein